MTEWNAGGYFERSALQKWMADRCLEGLRLDGWERVLDVGCGDGKITAEIAERLPRGSVVGVDASRHMVEFAAEHFAATHPNSSFRLADAARLPFAAEFDVAVSFNALHWVREQAAALAGIRTALRPGGRALLQMVSLGERRSLESVIEETCSSPRWSDHFASYRQPYIHFPPEEYRRLAGEAGFAVEKVDARLETWDFGSIQGFADFATVTFVEWTRMLPANEHEAFIADVLGRYRALGDGSAADAHVFHFYQMRAELRRE